jgi:hypothetical protein
MDAQAWCGLTKLREVFERQRSDLLVFRDEAGRELFDLPDAPRPDPDTPAPPRFLYDYENLLLSYADRSRAISPDIVRSVAPVTQESLSTFTLDGFVAGTWKVERVRAAAILTIKPLRTPAKSDVAALAEEGERLLDFLGPDASDRDIRIVEP